MKKKVFLLSIILVTSILTAGCTSLSQSHVQAFVNALHDNLSSNSQLTSWQEIPEGSDTIRVKYDIFNGSNSVVPTTTFDYRIKEFQTTSEATNFVNSMNEGYATTSKGFDSDVYAKVMGHSPGKTDAYMAVDSMIPPKARIIMQMDEFVVYGSATGSMFSTTSAASETPTVSVAPNSQHNAILENVVAERKREMGNLSGWKLSKWGVTWEGNDRVVLSSIQTGTAKENLGESWSITETLMAFSSTQVATDYLNRFDKSSYVLVTTDMSKSTNNFYFIPALSNPNIFQEWGRSAYNNHNNYEFSIILQYDNILQFVTSKQLV
jgi:hypothetical protein